MRNRKLILKGFHWNVNHLKKDSPENGRISFLSLNLTARCNARCLYCFVGPEINKKIRQKPLTLSEYKNIIKQAKNLGAKTICFAGVGEPTLDKNLKPLVKYINKLGLITVIYTNGLFKKELGNFFLKNNVSLIIKIDSLNKKHFEKLVGLPFNTYKENLYYLAKIFKKNIERKENFILTRLAANTVVTQINKKDIKQIANFCSRNNIKYFVAGLSKSGRASDKQVWTTLTGGKINELYNIVKKYNTWVSSATLDRRCGLFAHGITIDANGDLIGCPTVRWMRLGNIKNFSLKKLIGIYRKKTYSLKKHFCLGRELTLIKE
ncbi:MAG: radical SAM protein [Patescibacteria group bacterium]|nr:radical SAM protein [Patescibacteria group bacterium]